jgi:alkanesulfonate monooxygenase SsuD/methylene tetrahydromethanopterin reductase-like flavin-dependent oxidoreductase (luciferase family)
VGTWDHVQSDSSGWAMSCGWALLGSIATATKRIRITPLVVDMLNHHVSALAKESAMLALLSGGRFELGIGAGGWAEEQVAWGRELPPGPERVATLERLVGVLRRLWAGESVTIDEPPIRLSDARSAPLPPVPPRVIVGASTPRLVRGAVRYADGINLVTYGEEDEVPSLIGLAKREIEASGRPVELSILVGMSVFGSDPLGRLAGWRDQGVDRVFINLVSPYEQLPEALALAEQVAGA